MDESVHSTATELVQAARVRDWSALLDAHERLKCCHPAYRERLRSGLAP